MTVIINGNQITASVSGSKINADVSGGFGPRGLTGAQGPQGPAGTLPDSIDAFVDVILTNTAQGDVLRYNGSAWQNYSELNICDGGNF